MLVYIFNDSFYNKISLPIKINGMYLVYIDDKLVANIVADNNKWILQLTSDYYSSDVDNCNILNDEYNCYNIFSSNGKNIYYLVAIKKYDSNKHLYRIGNQISLGNHPSCDINFTFDKNLNINHNVLRITNIDKGNWSVETNSKYFFASGKRIENGQYIKNGDFIFFFGLRVSIIGQYALVINPKNIGVINGTSNFVIIPDIPDYEVKKVDDGDNIEPLFKKEDYFYKSPRFNYIIDEEKVDIDEPPTPFQEDDTPIILTIGPQLTMVCTSVLSMVNFLNSYITGSGNTIRFIISMLTMVVTIVGAVIWPSIARKYNSKLIKKKEKKRHEKYLKYLQQKRIEIQDIKDKHTNMIISNHPSIDRCLNIIDEKKKELWQRSIDHDDFLSIRVGYGTVDSKIIVSSPKEKFSIDGQDDLIASLKSLADESKNLVNVPICYDFVKQSINAIVGQKDKVETFLDCVFLQMMTFHAYTDLKIVVFTKNPNKWEYLKIIPHCWDNQKNTRYFATNIEEFSAIVSELEKTFDSRVKNDEEVQLEDDGDSKTTSNNTNFKDFRPYYLFFIDDLVPVRNLSLITKILHYKRNLGFSIIITSDCITTLPSETTDFICLGPENAAIVTSNIEDQNFFIPDLNSNNVDLCEYAKKLANIPLQVEREKYELPTSLSFMEMYNLGRVEQLNSLSRWNDNNPILSLSVPIGIDQNGEIFKMDIHEKAYGPHGLVAGTTGSGKSEWIVTYILSLAVNFSPEEVQFVLIDYKGGGLAKSFENAELGIKLPHLAGTITNLDKSEIYRSIAAIESELKRRQAVFNDAREKLKEGSMNIYKYQQFYRKHLVDEPMSHLLIICDEFAELKSQQPDFMDQLISTSRIGRSLGIHLILATQKPSGVVNDQIWSNSKFKVCLKVQDKADSNEVLKKPDAAFLKQTGSFYLQVGNDDYFNLGQSAWSGAKYYPSDVIKHKIDDSLQYIDNIGRVVGYYKEEDDNKVSESNGEELLNIVSYISKLSDQVSLKKRPLWLENIPDIIYLGDLYKKYSKSRRDDYDFNIAIGEYDEPREQKQGLLEINLAEGNVGIISQNSMSTEKLISTIIWSSLCEHSPSAIEYYIIDYGAETLKKFSKFPQVGEVVFQDEVEKVAGVLDLVIEEIDRRKELLSDYNGSFEYYNNSNKKKLPLRVCIINSYDAFIEAMPRLSDILTNLFRDASKYGIIFIVSVSSQYGLRQRQLQYFNHVIMMNMNDDSQYRSITNCRRGLIPKKTVGRGICKLDSSNADSYCEFQTASFVTPDKEIEFIKNFADKCVEFYHTKVKQLAKIPDDVSSDDLTKYITTLSDLPIGYSFYEKNIAHINLLNNKINFITSKSIKKNLPFIYGLSSVLSRVPNVHVRVFDLLNIFKENILDIKLFSDDIDVAIAALEKDTLTRKDTQDYAVNIIIGAGQYKNKLTKGGIEIFRNLCNHISVSKKSIYIFIDDYEKIRNLKVEKWYNNYCDDNGMWIGEGFSNQTQFKVNEVSRDDQKLNYKGLAFIVVDQKYQVIKTVMDGDK